MSLKKNPSRLVELLAKLEKERALGKRIVLCHGVFDLLHIGHIRYLRQAKELGDILVVTITPDRFVNKGPQRPAFAEGLRLEAISSLDCVDFAAINEWPTAEETLRLLKPDVYAKGAEFKNLEDATGKIAKENAVVEEISAKMIFIEDIVFSSSNLINRYLSSFSKDCQEYLELLRQRYSLADILGHLEKMRSLNVLVVGDMILDEYEYCSPLGASSKDPVLAVRKLSGEMFAGGAAAIANNIAQHAASVTLCTVIGDDEHEEFIRRSLAPNVTMLALRRVGTPTVIKRRIMDNSNFQKLIEIYHIDPTPLSKKDDATFREMVENAFPKTDITVAADFGHGCISPNTVKTLCSVPFLAVNTQANAGNRGYHTISRYHRADFISLAAHELAMEFRNESLSTGEMMAFLKEKLNVKTIIITEGRNGCAVVQDDFVRAPAFSVKAIDRVGAGDAFFSITALGAKLGFSPDLLAFCGNIAGALAVESIGNAKAVSRDGVYSFITSIMK